MGENDPKLPLIRKMIAVHRSGRQEYDPKPADEARSLLQIEQGDFLLSDDLEKTLHPRELDGNKSTFTPAERTAWSAFQTKYGIISPFGGYLFDRKVALANPQKARDELKAFFKNSREHPRPPAQWVWIKVENWQELAADLGFTPDDIPQLQSRLIKTFSEAYQVDGRPLNIRFTLKQPEGVKEYQEVYIGTKKEASVGSYLARSGNRRVFAKLIEEMQCKGTDNPLETWTREFPRSQLQVLLKVELWKYQLSHNGTPDQGAMDKIWNSPAISALRKKIPPSQLPSSPKDLISWMGQEHQRLLAAEFREKSSYTWSLGTAAETVARDFIRSEQARGKSLPKIEDELIDHPLFAELLEASYWGVNGMAVSGCDPQDVGNRDLGGLLIVNGFREDRMRRPKEERFQRMSRTIIHEVGHLLGLEHHFVTSIKDKSGPLHTIMVDGSYRNDALSRYRFLPENQEYLKRHLGFK